MNTKPHREIIKDLINILDYIDIYKEGDLDSKHHWLKMYIYIYKDFRSALNNLPIIEESQNTTIKELEDIESALHMKKFESK